MKVQCDNRLIKALNDAYYEVMIVYTPRQSLQLYFIKHFMEIQYLKQRKAIQHKYEWLTLNNLMDLRPGLGRGQSYE